MLCAGVNISTDLVGGPVQPNFDDHRKRGLRRHPAFRPAYDSIGVVPIIYGCGNCLIEAVFERLGRSCLRCQVQFPRRRRLTKFRTLPSGRNEILLGGGGFDHGDHPQVRTGPSWLALRGLRIGAINYHIEGQGRADALGRGPGCSPRCF